MNRREFFEAAAMSPLAIHRLSMSQSGSHTISGSILDVEGIRVGSYTDRRRPTGCTVILAEAGAVAGVDVRGGAPGTRDTDLLDPRQTVPVVHAILLSGGSAFGLAAADGVMRFLEEKGIGFRVGDLRVPIVPAAVLFDLAVGDGAIRPDAEAGYKACAAARGRGTGKEQAASLEEGNVGAGAGATVGKLLGMDRAMKGGLGTASIRLPDGLVVAALVAVNAVGDIRDPSNGRLIAGARRADGKGLADVMSLVREGKVESSTGAKPGENTTLGVVATNAELTKAEAGKVAQMAHDGLARTINPAHMPYDGDTLFVLATAKRKHAPDLHGIVGALAADAIAGAVISAIRHARGIAGFPAAGNI